MPDVRSMFYGGQPQQQQQAEVPQFTPQLILQSQMQQLDDEFAQRVGTLQQQFKSGMVDPKSYATGIQKLQADYDSIFFPLQNKKTQLEQLNQMATMGMVSDPQVSTASWKQVLPKTVLDEFMPDEPTTRAPLSVQQTEKIGGEAAKYLEAAAPRIPYLLLPESWEPHVKPKFDTLLDKYKGWRTLIGYDAMQPVQKAQVDKIWDEYAGSHKAWDPENPAVSALRSRGKLTSAYGQRISKTPTNETGMANPFQQEISKQIKKQEQPVQKEVMMISPDGRRGMMPAVNVQRALAAGYTEVK